MIERSLNIETLVLYPPVSIKKYSTLSKHGDRENIEVTISRIERMKNLEIITDIAKEVKEARFVKLRSMQSTSYYAHFNKKVKGIKS